MAGRALYHKAGIRLAAKAKGDFRLKVWVRSSAVSRLPASDGGPALEIFGTRARLV